MSFITDNFLLRNKVAEKLYHDFAENLPIIDYHCHLPQKDVAENRQFKDLQEIWLEGDHYKWRAMRTNGFGEEYTVGDAAPFDKFKAFAETLPYALRNPLYHWSHLELKRYFEIDTILDGTSAERIWKSANEKLQSPDFSAQGILNKFKVKIVCTTDDPVDDLLDHQKIREQGIGTQVLPTFRPDKAFNTTDLNVWNQWTDKLSEVSGIKCDDFDGFTSALKSRHDFFHSMGGRLSDHGLTQCPSIYPDEQTASGIFKKARSGEVLCTAEQDSFSGYLMVYFAQLDAEKGWTKQLHLGAMRNNNTALFKSYGPDAGTDSIGDYAQGETLSTYLGKLSELDCLPKIVLYNLNPADNYLMATMAGNFFGEGVPGKIQFGSGWWFLDQKEGMTWQLNALSNLGLLGRFVGMLTDSRSFMSYPRHEYFRRILCQLIGEDVVNGELPEDYDLLGKLVSDVCYGNASRFFGFDL